MKNLLIYGFFTLLLSTFAYAQDGAVMQESEIKKDSINFEEYSEFGIGKDFVFRFFKHNQQDFIIRNSPTIDLYYGNSSTNYNHYLFDDKFAPNGIINANFGSTSIKKLKDSDLLVKYDYSDLSVSNAKNSFSQTDAKNNEIRVDSWRLGLSSADGYGWAISENALVVLYHSSGIGWTALDFDRSEIINEQSYNTTKVFGKQLRFGKQFSAGTKVILAKTIGLTAEYEQTMVLPRHLFWKDAGSSLIQGAAFALAEKFSNRIARETPAAAPIVHFVLKSAISYGFYELYKDNMSWPFKTASPLMNTNYKVGLSFTF